jgi:hypothetical protein
MKKMILLAAMVLVCACAASAQSTTGQQGSANSVETGDNVKSSDLEGRKYGGAEQAGDGSNITIVNPGGQPNAPEGPSSTTQTESVSPTVEKLDNDVQPIIDAVPPNRRR